MKNLYLKEYVESQNNLGKNYSAILNKVAKDRIMKNVFILVPACAILIFGIVFFNVSNSLEPSIQNSSSEKGKVESRDEDYGTTIVESGYLANAIANNEIQPGTKVSLAVPIDENTVTTNDNKESFDEENITDQEKNSSVRKVEIQGDTPEALEYFRKEKEKEDRTLILLKKYYGEDEINRIAENMKGETSGDNEYEGKYQFPESGKELLEKMLALIESENISEADKQDLIDVISKIEIGFLDDKELKNRIEKYKN